MRLAMFVGLVCLCLARSASASLIVGADSITESSDLGGYPASNAIDGNSGTFTHTNGPSDTAPSLTYDLPGGDYNLDSLTIYNRVGCCEDRLRDITVIVRDAANTTTEFMSALLNPGNILGGPASISVDLTGITGGIVIIERTPDGGLNNAAGEDGNGGYVMSISELQVFGTAVPEPGSLCLLGLGAIGLLAVVRRRSA